MLDSAGWLLSGAFVRFMAPHAIAAALLPFVQMAFPGVPTERPAAVFARLFSFFGAAAGAGPERNAGSSLGARSSLRALG